jgi:hypothetical protein
MLPNLKHLNGREVSKVERNAADALPPPTAQDLIDFNTDGGPKAVMAPLLEMAGSPPSHFATMLEKLRADESDPTLAMFAASSVSQRSAGDGRTRVPHIDVPPLVVFLLLLLRPSFFFWLYESAFVKPYVIVPISTFLDYRPCWFLLQLSIPNFATTSVREVFELSTVAHCPLFAK